MHSVFIDLLTLDKTIVYCGGRKTYGQNLQIEPGVCVTEYACTHRVSANNKKLIQVENN